MCEFHDSNCNGFGDMWWTDKCIYFSSIDSSSCWLCSGLFLGLVLGQGYSTGHYFVVTARIIATTFFL